MAWGTDGARIIYVDDDGSPNDDGSSWTRPLKYLQNALSIAEDPANGVMEIRVGEGVYRPDERLDQPDGSGDRLKTFRMRSGLRIIGGYRGHGTPNPNERDPALYITILSGDLDGNDGPNFTNRTDNSAHVVTAEDVDHLAVLDGFNVAGGSMIGNVPGPGNPSVHGAGMYLRNSNVRIRDVVFRDNHVGDYSDGHAVYVESGSPVFEDCIIRDNVRWTSNTGAFGSRGRPLLLNCLFERNENGVLARAGKITAVGCTFRQHSNRTFETVEADAVVRDSQFISNGSYGDGMAAYFYLGNAEVINCDFIGNSVDHGVVDMHSADGLIAGCFFSSNLSYDASTVWIDGNVTVRNCVLMDNQTTSTDLGAIEVANGSLHCQNTVIANTTSSDPIYTIHLKNASFAEFINCTIAGNGGAIPSHGLFLKSGVTVHLTNSIVWGNGPAIEDAQLHIEPGATFVMNYSCLQAWGGNPYGGAANFAFDPLFVSPYDDLHLNVTLNVDSATPSAVLPCAIDLDGNLRVVDDPAAPGHAPSVVDRGAYERSSQSADDCDGDGLEDECATLYGFATDCNGNGVPDYCDARANPPTDCNRNFIPDECENMVDCNNNGISDECDFIDGLSVDCNGNGVPDTCDLAGGASFDCNSNSMPDECEIDCDDNGVPDDCDIATGSLNDTNQNLIPDACENIRNQNTGRYFATIGYAIEQSGDGHVVIVQPGTYPDTIDFLGKEIVVRSAMGPEVTVLGGSGLGATVTFENLETSATELRGFTIIGGGGFDYFGHRIAGAMSIRNSHPTIRECIFRDSDLLKFANGLTSRGGAVYVNDSSMPQFINCEFRNNIAHYGGAAYVNDESTASFLNCDFQSNSVPNSGGAIYVLNASVTLQFCEFIDNRSESNSIGSSTGGGALHLSGNRNSVAVGCVFRENSANRGGAVLQNGAELDAHRCLFQNNYARHEGGALLLNNLRFITRYMNCIFFKNSAGARAGAASLLFESDPDFIHCTFVDNDAPETGGLADFAGRSSLIGCILWNNTGGSVFTTPNGMDNIQLCDVDQFIPGSGNFQRDPMFVNAADGDFDLQPGSPCIDAGITSTDLLPYPGDFYGLTRWRACRVDIGAIETGATGIDCNMNSASDGCDLLNGLIQDCDDNGLADECEVADGFAPDCNHNGVPDICDLIEDCNKNGVLDECESDCNANNVPDDCDISQHASGDCNNNLTPDECDIASGDSFDANANGLPDECEPDCNMNGLPDFIEVFFGFTPDCNGNMVPDECDIIESTSRDCNANDVPDECDILSGSNDDLNSNGVPDDCEAMGDITGDGIVDADDLFLLLANWGSCKVPCPPNCTGDIIGPSEFPDCIIDVHDLFRLLANWK